MLVAFAQTDLRGKGEARDPFEKRKSVVHYFEVENVFEGDGYVISTGSAVAMTMENQQ